VLLLLFRVRVKTTLLPPHKLLLLKGSRLQKAHKSHRLHNPMRAMVQWLRQSPPLEWAHSHKKKAMREMGRTKILVIAEKAPPLKPQE
jgi:hypothetical protein